MTRIKLVGLCIMALFALGAVAATSAVATPAHIYKEAGAELTKGETREIRAGMQSPTFVLKGKGALEVESVTTCKKLKLNETEHPEIIGGNPGTSAKEVIEFEECSATVGGSKCEKVEVTNAATNNELVTIDLPTERTGKLATLFTPATGKVFSTVKFTKCGLFGNQSATVEGTSAAWINPEATEATRGCLVWTEKEITEIQKQNGSKEPVGLKANSKLATLRGESWVELVNGQIWGAF